MTSTISIDECFSFPQRPSLKSERLNVKVKSHAGTLTVADLKKAIVRKGYPSLSDPSRITLIIPIGMFLVDTLSFLQTSPHLIYTPPGQGTLLRDDTLASNLPKNPTILALVSNTPNETHRLTLDTLPPILYVYTSSALRVYIKMPAPMPSPHSKNWTGIHLAWNMPLEELVFHFIKLGFNQQDVWKEATRLNNHFAIASGPFAQLDHTRKGYLAPQLMFRLWDVAGLNKLAALQQRALTGNQSEFEVYTASCFSVDSASSVATIRGLGPPPPTPPPALPSVIMASPSEHSSAYDDAFYQHMVPPSTRTAPTVSSSSDGSQSCASSVVDGMDWTLDHHRAAVVAASSSNIHHEQHKLPFETSSHVAKLVKKVNQLTLDRDKAIQEAQRLREALTTGDEAAAAALAMSSVQADHYEAERLQLSHQLDGLNQINEQLREEVRAEVKTVEELLDRLQKASGKEQEARGTVQQIQENLVGVVSCPICCERYGSLSANRRRRPIHLSCGHIFCATCLDADWTSRADSGIPNPARCFNRCNNFDPSRLAEIYLLEDVKELLDRLASPIC